MSDSSGSVSAWSSRLGAGSMKALAAVTLVLLAAGSAAAQPRDEARPRDLQRLQDDLENLDDALRGLEAGDARAEEFPRREDRFEASVLRAVRSGDRVAIPAGTRVRGIVRDVERAQRPSRAGRLDLDFDSLYLDRERLDLRARVVSVSEDDRREGPSTAGKAGIGATLGAILGGVLGGSKGALIGILVGGTGAVAGTKGEEVELPAGTVVRIRLERPLTLSRS